jgi:hypothetical protein
LDKLVNNIINKEKEEASIGQTVLVFVLSILKGVASIIETHYRAVVYKDKLQT